MSNLVTKSYMLEEKHIDYIGEQSRQNGGSSDAAALRFILDDHMKWARIRENMQLTARRHSLKDMVVEMAKDRIETAGRAYLDIIRDQLNAEYGDADYALTTKSVALALQENGFDINRDSEGRSFAEPGEVYA